MGYLTHCLEAALLAIMIFDMATNNYKGRKYRAELMRGFIHGYRMAQTNTPDRETQNKLECMAEEWFGVRKGRKRKATKQGAAFHEGRERGLAEGAKKRQCQRKLGY